jgi:hypothetical protein
MWAFSWSKRLPRMLAEQGVWQKTGTVRSLGVRLAQRATSWEPVKRFRAEFLADLLLHGDEAPHG